jgi:hypothetical protein
VLLPSSLPFSLADAPLLFGRFARQRFVAFRVRVGALAETRVHARPNPQSGAAR